MIRTGNLLPGLAAALTLTACASAPMHYYTLVPPASAHTTSPADAAPSLPFELLAVGIPAQVDQPQLLVREGGQGVALLGSERWIAPLGDEVRGALSADLARELHSQDVSGLPNNDKPTLRVKLDVRRFDSQPGSYALIEGAWSVRLMHAQHPALLACTSRVSESVGPGYDALVQGHQQAIATLAAQIAVAARAMAAGQSASCPTG
jgi:uncharacterized lipoprotein YmbA